MIVDLISDLHGHYPELQGGDLLIVAGDLTTKGTFPEYCDIFQKIAQSNYSKKVLIAGNHDNLLLTDNWFAKMAINFDYLCDSGTEYEGLKIWGSPWTRTFKGISPLCCAFTGGEKALKSNFDLIPLDTDILITHSPPFGIFDSVEKRTVDGIVTENTGSPSLRSRILSMTNLKLHVFGHIHKWGGQIFQSNTSKFVNASIVNEAYKPVHEIVRITL